MANFEFKDGDILFVAKKGFSLIGAVIKNAQRDFGFEHVCQVFFDPLENKMMVYTTGAGGFPFYNFGAVPLDKYLKGRHVAVGRYEGLTTGQIDAMFYTVQELMGKIYPWWKVIGLAIQGRFATDFVRRLGWKAQKKPKRSFCAGCVAYCLYMAGIEYEDINPKYPKEEADAFTPEVLYDAPRMKIVYTTKD